MFTLVPLKMINCIPQMEVLVKRCDYLKYLKTDLSYKPLWKYVKNEKILSLLAKGKAYSKEATERLKTMCLKWLMLESTENYKMLHWNCSKISQLYFVFIRCLLILKGIKFTQVWFIENKFIEVYAKYVISLLYSKAVIAENWK